jgi:uncharacterized protein
MNIVFGRMNKQKFVARLPFGPTCKIAASNNWSFVVNPDSPQKESLLLQGLALFNARDFFHAHEFWEDLWRETAAPDKQVLQGLIQIAVAMHHYSTANFDGARSVMERALRNLEAAEDPFHGLDMTRLRQDLRRAIEQLNAGAEVTHFEIARR